MSRPRLSALAFLFSLSAPLWGQSTPLPLPPKSPKSAAESRLVFRYPCTFQYTDGAPYTPEVRSFECDYLHASVETEVGADQYFNALPTLAAQKAFLESALPEADAAHDKWVLDIAAAVKADSPARLPKSLSSEARIAKLAKLNWKLWNDSIAASKPFLWPPAQPDSYLRGEGRSYPDSWKPYFEPTFAESRGISTGVDTTETGMIDSAAARLKARLSAKLMGLVRDGGSGPTLADLNRAFDGGGAHATVAAVGLTAGPPPSMPGPPGLRPGTISDLNVPAPPSPLDTIPSGSTQRADRNYFSRGPAAGAQRLKDDATLAAWHALGVTKTIGDPYAKVPYIVQQLNGTCGVGAQYEALKARGQDVTMAGLTKTAFDHGWYTEYTSGAGAMGGMYLRDTGALLKLHGVASTTTIGTATGQELATAVRASGDAIVAVNPKIFWNDPTVPDGAMHFVYVSGMEVDNKGAVRGYYVNDTGNGEGGRFVPIKLFDQAWLHSFTAIQPPAPRSP
ncbi:MAG: hypothetical protein HKL90_15875 [Elusimicrobia bacterium]|nr:hypothetical protein [Elusimicrobiota bacterium]